MTDPTTMTVGAGALVRRQFRGELERLKFLGHKIEWYESKGWIESDFTIRAKPNVLRAISVMLEEWNASETTHST